MPKEKYDSVPGWEEHEDRAKRNAKIATGFSVVLLVGFLFYLWEWQKSIPGDLGWFIAYVLVIIGAFWVLFIPPIYQFFENLFLNTNKYNEARNAWFDQYSHQELLRASWEGRVPDKKENIMKTGKKFK